MNYYPSIVFYLLALLFIHTPSIAQQTELMYPVGINNESDLQDMAIDPSGIGYAVGNCGLILKTEDHGQNWEVLPFTEDVPLLHLAIEKDSDGLRLAVSDDRTLYRSEDGGLQWTAIVLKEDPDVTIMDLASPRRKRLIVLHSDYSTTLFSLSARSESRLADHSYDLKEGEINFTKSQWGWVHTYRSQNLDGLFLTRDGGFSWIDLSRNLPSQVSRIRDMDPLEEETIYLMTETSDRQIEIYKATDGGFRWNKHMTIEQTINYAKELFAISEDEVWFVSSSHSLYTYNQQSNMLDVKLRDRTIKYEPFKVFLDEDHGQWVTRGNHSIQYSTKEDQQWHTKTKNPPVKVVDMHFPAENKIVAFGNPFGKVSSSDGGATWQVQHTDAPEGKTFLQSVDLGQDRYLVAFREKGWYILEDGNLTQTLESDAVFLSAAVDPLDKNIVYAVEASLPSRLYKSVNGGVDWTVVHEFLYGVHQIEIPAHDLLYVTNLGFPANMDKSEDGGKTWSPIIIQESLIMFEISFSSPYYGVILTYPTALTTDNGGLQFDVKGVPENFVNTILLESKEKLWGTRKHPQSSALLFSDDEGQSWEEVFRSSCWFMNDLFINPYNSDIWIASEWGGLYKYQQEAVNNPTKSEPNDICLFPNPVGNFLTIEAPLAGRNIQQFNFYNSSGQLVWQHPISHAAKTFIDTSWLPNGLYFVEALGPDESKVKKFIKQ
ncbi:MAG: YCF48-related protein [Bacteroidota bacterium]